MYTQKGCPHCEDAKNFFASKNISIEVIEIGFDPIIQAGMRAASPNGQGLPLPVTISFPTQETLVGNATQEFERIVAVIRSAVAPNSAS